MENAAARVRDHLEPLISGDHAPVLEPASAIESAPRLRGNAAGWAREAALLLERRSRRASGQDVHLPGHISASTLVDLGEDPAG
ncbi:hypothetical protein AHiyo4_33260 [Arthrobacter sp. Hiyo4]|nr:hypothetical protein AHiyo4_33260 [Arthrobacter sp. Hiyo4]